MMTLIATPQDKANRQKSSSGPGAAPFIALLGLLLFALMICLDNNPADERFVRIENGRFVLEGRPYVFAGMNYWQGAYLGADIIPGGRLRLVRELDLMRKNGITNLRITAASEKSEIERSVRPAFQEAPGVYNEKLLRGLDLLLSEMAKRNMHAVLVMGNYWEWSGGMAQYISWVNQEPVVDPGKVDDATRYMSFAARFYGDKDAWKPYFDYLAHVTLRVNTVTGIAYNEDPTILSWELANEPRPHPKSKEISARLEEFYAWINASSKQLHALAPKQLVTVGNEGSMGCLNEDEIYLKAHALPSVDYMTFHIWPKNWGWFNPEDEQNTLQTSISRTLKYFEQHVQFAGDLGKPTVLEEFGIGRDGENPSPEASVHSRDRFLKAVLQAVEKDVADRKSIAGTNFWAWGGEGRAADAEATWVEGKDFTGDPPQEPQGLNSVFDTDASTLTLFREHASRLSKIIPTI